MLLKTHSFNNHPIDQLTQETRLTKFNVPAGYVNATQMCQANGKKWNHYASLDSTKAYWAALSSDTGIPASELVLTIRGGNDEQRRAQGTWVHPEIAIDLAQWVSVEFRIWANRELKRVIEETQSKNQFQHPETQPSTPTPSIKEISIAFDTILPGFDPNLIAQIKLKAIATLHPELATVAEIANNILRQQTKVPEPEQLLNPTRISEILTHRTNDYWSAKKVNIMLLEQGFQAKNPYGSNPPYFLTEKGKAYGKIVVTKMAISRSTVKSVRWFPEVLEAIEI